ncbi:MAG: GGDEF domain-containing protein [Ruminococcus sp.]|nr:GGDEF domain-containing protein [Ruminococcus sp.]
MKDNFFISDNFMRFYKAVRRNFESQEDALSAIRDNFVTLKDEMLIARLEYHISAANDIDNAKDESAVLFDSVLGYENDPYEFVIETSDKGVCFITVFPVPGKHWDADDRKRLEIFSFMLYNLAGKGKMAGIANHLLLTDVLTGVSNSNGFLQYCGMLKKMGLLSNYTAFYLNIKTFKFINRQAGPRYGDEILREYVQILSGYLGKGGKLARLGGDNFAGLVYKEQAEEFIKFVSAVKITKMIDSHIRSFTINARLGLYSITPQATPSDLMNNISTAFNYAKNVLQRDYAWFEPSMLEVTMRNKEISFMFPKAIKNREFVVYYQPKVSLTNDTLCGCEALVRWQREGKIVPPMTFIPLFESDGTVCTLDFYVLDTVCRDIKDWCDRGITPVRVSVNFSKNHMRNFNLAQDVITVVEKYGIDPKYLEIELTEMSGYVDRKAMTDFVCAMHDYGITTSIDDFGTGYSSLMLIKNLPVDVIKLDKSFIDNISDVNSEDCTFVKDIINMIRDIDLETVSEGVETKVQADFLTEINCEIAQGYLFSKPIPHDEFEQKLTDGGKYTRE